MLGKKIQKIKYSMLITAIIIFSAGIVTIESKIPVEDAAASPLATQTLTSAFLPFTDVEGAQTKIQIKVEELKAPEVNPLTPTPILKSTNTPVPVVATSNSGDIPSTGQWAGSPAEWANMARGALLELGCTPEEVEQMIYIHANEGGPNSVNWDGPYYGGWQLDAAKVRGIPGYAWWDPILSTQRAYAYVISRYGSVYNAYIHKKNQDWY